MLEGIVGTTQEAARTVILCLIRLVAVTSCSGTRLSQFILWRTGGGHRPQCGDAPRNPRVAGQANPGQIVGLVPKAAQLVVLEDQPGQRCNLTERYVL